MTAQMVEDTWKRIQLTDGVIGFMIMDIDGIAIKSTLDNSATVQYAGLVQGLIGTSKKFIKKVDPTDDLSFLRLRTKKHEICIVLDKQYILIIIQNPVGSKPPM